MYDVIIAVVEASEAVVAIMAGLALIADVSLVSDVVVDINETAIADLRLDIKADVALVTVANLVSDAVAIVAVADERKAVVAVIVGFAKNTYVK